MAKSSRKPRRRAITPSREFAWRPVDRATARVKTKRVSKAEWNRVGDRVARAYDALNAALVDAWLIGDMNVLQGVRDVKPVQFEYRVTRTVVASTRDKIAAADIPFELVVASGRRG